MKLRGTERGRVHVVIAAVLLLLLGLSVGPAAASHLVVRSSDIVNGQVRTPDLRNGAVATPKLRKGAVTTPKLRNRAVKAPKIAPGAVTSAKIRNGHVRRPDLAGGVVAARAVALVNGDGTVDGSRSQNIQNANVTRSGNGIYCVSLPFQPLSATGTAEQGGDNAINVSLTSTFIGCGGAQISIATRANGSLADRDFLLVVF